MNSPFEDILKFQRRLEQVVIKSRKHEDNSFNVKFLREKTSHIVNVLSCLVHYANKGERIPDKVRAWLEDELNEIRR